MDGLVGPLVILAAFGVALGGMAWLASRVRRRGGGGSVLGPFEEIWHPAAYRARIETQVQEERAAPAPSPGDRPFEQAAEAAAAGRPGPDDASIATRPYRPAGAR